MKRMLIQLIPMLYLVATPYITLAQQSNQTGTVLTLINRITLLVNPLIALLSGFAIIAFVRGVAVFIWSAGNEEKRTEGKKFMIWGVIGMFVLFSFWGMVRFVQVFYFGTGIGTPFQPPF